MITAICFRAVLMEEQKECKEQENALREKIQSYVPTLKPVNRKKVELAWDHLVDNVSINCLDRVELRGKNDIVLASKNNHDRILEKKPFIHELDICMREKNQIERTPFTL